MLLWCSDPSAHLPNICQRLALLTSNGVTGTVAMRRVDISELTTILNYGGRKIYAGMENFEPSLPHRLNPMASVSENRKSCS
jgi:hypothetical protein